VAYRLPGGRVTLTVDEGPYAGAWAEVERLGSWLVYSAVGGLIGQALVSEAGRAKALAAAYRIYCVEAQPAWDIEDHHGRVPATPAGMKRLPEPLALEFIADWIATWLPVEQEATAVDELVAPGELRDEMNARLRAVS
jgi:hypothetical protein